MAFDAGTIIGPYELTGLIGAGGMGEVYRAHDTRLRRDVAIKFSAERFSERFEREARAVAALNHPNVCTLFDVGPNYLVMELVDGPTLAERMRQGRVPPAEAWSIARQITDALKAAHEAGIVHRDLKPANIKLKPDGTVKVLDFGLAKITALPERESDLRNSPTISLDQATGAGAILGTAAYMSPEQARGKAADKRSDIWSFGVVLYEMFAGERLFDGETVSDTLAAVLTKEPDWNRVPTEARILLRRCLTRDAKQRLQDIGDAMPLFKSAPQYTRPSRTPAAVAGWTLAAIFAIALGFALWLPSRSTRERPHQLQFSIAAPNGQVAGYSVSPDGANIVVAITDSDDKTRLWLRPLDAVDGHLLADTDTQTPGFTIWSFDSRFLVYASTDGKLKKIDVHGGSPQTLTDVRGSLLGGSWNRDGQIILYSLGNNQLIRVPASGGAPSTIIDGSRIFAAFPGFLSDGRHFIYTDGNTNANTMISSLDSDSGKPLSQSGMSLAKEGTLNVTYVPSTTSGIGYLLFVRGNTLLAQHFDDRQFTLIGEAVPVADEVGFYWASRNTVVYTGTTTGNYQLTWLDAKGNTLGTVAETGPYLAAKISPDGTRAAVGKFGDTRLREDIWLVDIVRGTSERVTSTGGFFPVWSADGEWIAYAVFGNDVSTDIFRRSVTTAKEELLFHTNEALAPSSWSSDGRYLLYDVPNPKNGRDIGMISLDAASVDARKKTPLISTPYNETAAVFSPDEKWIAFISDESGRSEVYARSFTPGKPGELPTIGPRFPVSIGGGVLAFWRSDSKQLIYSSPGRDLMAVDLTNDAARPFGRPKLIRKNARAGALLGDVAPDGQRSLVLMPVGESENSQLNVIVNWQSRLP
jgi:serine/threonine protein kinase